MKNLLIPLFCLSSAIVSAQAINKIINAKEVERIEAILSSDSMQGRRAFTPAIEKATDFILQYDEEGISLYQRNVTLPANIITPKHKKITLSNYIEQNFDTTGWTDVMKRGHDFVISSIDFYNDSPLPFSGTATIIFTYDTALVYQYSLYPFPVVDTVAHTLTWWNSA